MTVIVVYPLNDGPMEELSRDERIEQVARAQAIAVIAHRGQTDKLGVAYIYHPAAVSFGFDPVDSTVACCAAWLHDVLEDTDVTADDLDLAGVHREVIDVVELLTRRDGDGDAYYARIARHPVAREVKLADIADNTEPSRVSRLDPQVRERLHVKYLHALGLLGEEWPNHWQDAQGGGSEFGSRRFFEYDSEEDADDHADADQDEDA